MVKSEIETTVRQGRQEKGSVMVRRTSAALSDCSIDDNIRETFSYEHPFVPVVTAQDEHTSQLGTKGNTFRIAHGNQTSNQKRVYYTHVFDGTVDAGATCSFFVGIEAIYMIGTSSMKPLHTVPYTRLDNVKVSSEGAITIVAAQGDGNPREAIRFITHEGNTIRKCISANHVFFSFLWSREDTLIPLRPYKYCYDIARGGDSMRLYASADHVFVINLSKRKVELHAAVRNILSVLATGDKFMFQCRVKDGHHDGIRTYMFAAGIAADLSQTLNEIIASNFSEGGNSPEGAAPGDNPSTEGGAGGRDASDSLPQAAHEEQLVTEMFSRVVENVLSGSALRELFGHQDRRTYEVKYDAMYNGIRVLLFLTSKGVLVVNPTSECAMFGHRYTGTFSIDATFSTLEYMYSSTSGGDAQRFLFHTEDSSEIVAAMNKLSAESTSADIVRATSPEVAAIVDAGNRFFARRPNDDPVQIVILQDRLQVVNATLEVIEFSHLFERINKWGSDESSFFYDLWVPRSSVSMAAGDPPGVVYQYYTPRGRDIAEALGRAVDEATRLGLSKTNDSDQSTVLKLLEDGNDSSQTPGFGGLGDVPIARVKIRAGQSVSESKQNGERFNGASSPALRSSPELMSSPVQTSLLLMEEAGQRDRSPSPGGGGGGRVEKKSPISQMQDLAKAMRRTRGRQPPRSAQKGAAGAGAPGKGEKDVVSVRQPSSAQKKVRMAAGAPLMYKIPKNDPQSPKPEMTARSVSPRRPLFEPSPRPKRSPSPDLALRSFLDPKKRSVADPKNFLKAGTGKLVNGERTHFQKYEGPSTPFTPTKSSNVTPRKQAPSTGRSAKSDGKSVQSTPTASSRLHGEAQQSPASGGHVITDNCCRRHMLIAKLRQEMEHS